MELQGVQTYHQCILVTLLCREQEWSPKDMLDHGRLYRWTENSFPFFLYLKPVEISKKFLTSFEHL